MEVQVDAAGIRPARPLRTGRHPRSPRDLWAEHWPVVGLALLAVVVSVVVHHWVFPAYSWNRDEPVYLWQVHALRDGQILPTDGGMPTFFQPWLSGHGDGYFFSQYTLGWPIVLLVGEVVFGTAASALAFGTLLAVVGTYALARTVTGDRTVSIVSAALMLASPIVIVQSGVYLGYLFTLGLGLLFGAALLTGFERRRPVLLVAAGALVGWIFMTRPFDAVLWAAAFGGYLAVVHRREWRRLFGGGGWAALGAAPLVVATLLYNRKVTGSFTEFPITAADPLDTFGFGLRRLMPTIGEADYTVSVAFRSLARNGLFVPLFLFGGYLGVVVAGFGLWMRRRQRTTLALVLLAVVFPLGYFFFWGLHVSAATADISGPIYFIPLFAPLVVLVASALVSWCRERRGLGIATVVVLAVVTVPLAVNRVAVNERISASQVPWRDNTDAIHGRATVFVEQAGAYLLHLNPLSANNADLDGRILYAADRRAADLALIDRHPDRRPYLQRTSVPPNVGTPDDDPPTPEVTLERIRVREVTTATLRTTIRNTTGAPVVVASLDVGGRVQQRMLDTRSTRGATYDVDWPIAAGTAVPGAASVPAGVGDVTVGAGFGADEPTARRPSVRVAVPYQADTSRARLVLPVRSARLGEVDGKQAWIETPSVPQLRVRVTA